MTLKVEDILAKVEAQTTVIGSVETTLTELSARLKEAITENDPMKLQAIADELDANTTRLSAAVVANTPAAPPPADPPTS